MKHAARVGGAALGVCLAIVVVCVMVIREPGRPEQAAAGVGATTGRGVAVRVLAEEEEGAIESEAEAIARTLSLIPESQNANSAVARLLPAYRVGRDWDGSCLLWEGTDPMWVVGALTDGTWTFDEFAPPDIAVPTPDPPLEGVFVVWDANTGLEIEFGALMAPKSYTLLDSLDGEQMDIVYATPVIEDGVDPDATPAEPETLESLAEREAECREQWW
jgi:hypothetical protein